MLSCVPPNVVTQIERAKSDSPTDAEALLRVLTSDDAPPAQLVSRILAIPPEWLTRSASPYLWVAVGEFASAHACSEEAVGAFVQAAERGGPEAPVWMARAAFSATEHQYERSKELIARARKLAGVPHPFVEVMGAAIEVAKSEEVAPVLEAAEAYEGDDLLVEMIRGRALYVLKRRAEALAVFEAALENHPGKHGRRARSREVTTRAVRHGRKRATRNGPRACSRIGPASPGLAARMARR